jgi:tetratricopeptide (TPR) repeat protein
MRRAAAIAGVLAAALFAGTGAAANTTPDADPNQAADLNARGVEAYNAKHWDEAGSCFEKAYDLAPDNATVRRNLCNTYQAQANELAKAADFAGGAEKLVHAISVDPENPSALAQLGSYYLRMDMVNDAVFRLEDSLELDPGNLDVQELLGDAYYRANDLPAALAQWDAVRERGPNRNGLREKIEKASREEGVEGRFTRSRSAHFEISYASGTSGGDLGAVLQTLERAYRDIGRQLGAVYPPGPIAVIVYTADDFAKATLLGEHVGALYDGKIRVPIRDKAGQAMTAQELERRLNHEYTHVVVRFLVAGNVPWWLNEGLAETLSNSLSPSDMDLLRQANAAGALLPLASLETEQLKRLDPASLEVAYLQAHATVDFLWRRYGVRGLSPMLDGLAQDQDAETALTASYRQTYDTLQREVSASLGRSVSRR